MVQELYAAEVLVELSSKANGLKDEVQAAVQLLMAQ